MQLEIFGDTDIGKKREINEDNYLCLEISQGLLPLYLLVVADGMGGHSGGEIASSMAVELFKNTVLHQLKDGQGSDLDFRKILEESSVEVNKAVYKKASEDLQLTGMATTMVAALISGHSATISNIGDSRAYLIRKKCVEQITVDHTWKNNQLQKKEFSEEDILNSPFRNMVTNALGLDFQVKVDIFTLELTEEDYLFLCSDGVYSLLKDKEILKVFKKAKKPKRICQKIIQIANDRGGHDNITALVVRAGRKEKEKTRLASPSDTIRLDSSEAWEQDRG